MNRNLLSRHRLRNALQTVLLLAGMALLAASIGLLLAGVDGLLMALAALAMALLVNPALGPETLLRLYGARPLSGREAGALQRLVVELSARAGLARPPALWYLPSPVINAFTTGCGERAALGVSDGLLRRLPPREVAAVLAHEVCHLRNDDTRVMGLADLLTRLTHVLAMTGLVLLALQVPLMVFGLSADGTGMLAMLLLALSPGFSALLQLALSRTREFDADLGAVELTGDPRALADALQHIEQSRQHPFEQLLLPGRRLPQPSLLRSHPDTADRVRRLLELTPPRTGPLDYLYATGRYAPLAVPRRGPPRWHVSGLWH